MTSNGLDRHQSRQLPHHRESWTEREREREREIERERELIEAMKIVCLN